MIYLKLSDTLFIKLKKARSHKYISRKPDGKGGWIYAYSKKPGEGRNAINYNDMKEFGYEKAVEISKDTESIRGKEIEHSFFYNKNGEKIFKKIGTRENIKYTKEEMLIFDSSRLTIHNHNNGSSFSSRDLILLLQLNITEMRVVGHGDKKIITNFYIKKTEKAIGDISKTIGNKLLQDVVVKSSQLKFHAIINDISSSIIELEIEKYAYSKFNEYNKEYYEYGKY